MERFPLPLGAWDWLRYFIVALPEPSYNYITCLDAFYYRVNEQQDYVKLQKNGVSYDLMCVYRLTDNYVFNILILIVPVPGHFLSASVIQS